MLIDSERVEVPEKDTTSGKQYFASVSDVKAVLMAIFGIFQRISTKPGSGRETSAGHSTDGRDVSSHGEDAESSQADERCNQTEENPQYLPHKDATKIQQRFMVLHTSRMS